MALGDRLAGDVHHRRRTTRLRDLTTQPQRRNQGPEVEDPDRPAPHPRPNQKRRPSDQIRTHRNKSRWIEAELALTGDAKVHRAAADQMAAALAGILGVDPSTIESRIDAEHACGRTHGSADVTVTATLDDDLHTEVELGFEVTQAGGIPEVACTVRYDIEPDLSLIHI